MNIILHSWRETTDLVYSWSLADSMWTSLKRLQLVDRTTTAAQLYCFRLSIS